jgi:sacsin
VSLRDALVEVVWVRRMEAKPTFYPKCLTWFEGDLFCKPANMVSQKYAHLVGSVMAVIAVDVSESVQQAFHWNSSPDLHYIVKHLQSVIAAFDGKEKAAFAETMDCIYNLMSKHTVDDVRNALDSNGVKEWVWHGEGFAQPQNVFFNEAFMDLMPYVYCLPWELQQHHALFTDLGVCERCSLPDVLTMIRDRNQHEDYNSEKVKRDLHLSVSILNELKSHVTDDMLNELQEKLWLPVHDASGRALQMAPLLDCTYCDMEWIRQGRCQLQTFCSHYEGGN